MVATDHGVSMSAGTSAKKAGASLGRMAWLPALLQRLESTGRAR